MALKSSFADFKTTGYDKHDIKVYIEDVMDYCTMQNYFDPSKKTEAAKRRKPEKAMTCLRASLSPASSAVYKYSLELSAEDLGKFHLVINAPREL